jgi:hypothetical protein
LKFRPNTWIIYKYKNGIFNNNYEYDTIGIPLLASVGKKILSVEKDRTTN